MSLTPVSPLISVLLPAYNCSKYLAEAIKSTLQQTMSNFELIAVDDASTDGTGAILEEFQRLDKRIILHRNPKNSGISGSLNNGLRLARGKYIARMDGDDVCLLERFARQVAYLDAHPECALLGTWAEIWEGDSPTTRKHCHPSNLSRLKYELLFNNPFVHSSVMMRKDVLDHVGGYCTDLNRQPPEDYELWSRIARYYEVANLPEILIQYREMPGSFSRALPKPFPHLVTISAENLAWASGTPLSSSSVWHIAALTHNELHRVKNVLNVRDMRDVLRRAVNSIAKPEDKMVLLDEADKRLDHLISDYLIKRYNHKWQRPIRMILKRYFSLEKRL